jgi:hypothetical protein
MSPEHKESILPLLLDFRKLEIEEKLIVFYKDYQDFKSIYIGYYTLIEFSLFSKKAMTKIEQLINSKDFSIFPFHYNFQNDFGSGNLRDDIYNYLYLATQNDFNNAVTHLYRLVYYLVQNGFWLKEDRIEYKRENEYIQNLKNNLSLITEKIEQNRKYSTNLLNELTNEKSQISSFIQNKNQEFSEISNLLPIARKHNEEINALFNSSIDTNQQILGLLNQQNTNLETTKERIKSEAEIFDNLVLEFKNLKHEIDSQLRINEKNNTHFETQLASILDKSKNFDERLNILNEIIGKEAAVAVFNTFNTRKSELKTSIKIWGFLVFIIGIIAMVLIISIFTNFFGHLGGYPNNIDWKFLVISSIKSIPIMATMYFTIKQYTRERNFQEEYAFRSAIALTVQAYGDMAGSKREELIAKAVENIYKTPTMMSEKRSFMNIRAQSITNTLNELIENVKQLKP